jgi:hypothetical protein
VDGPDDGVGVARHAPEFSRWSPEAAFRVVLAAFVVGYGAAAAFLILSVEGPSALYPGGLVLLVLLGAGVFVGNLLDRRKSGQRFYLALSIIPGLTVARLAFTGMPPEILNPLFVYLLLAVTVLVFRQTTGTPSGLRELTRDQWARALPLGGALAVGLAILGILLFAPGGWASGTRAWIPVLIVAPVAFLDEFWFHGLFQRGLAGVTSAKWGWIATAAIFAAYGAPFCTPATFAFRSAYGLALGALAMRRENLPVVLLARTGMVVAIAALNPGLVGSGLLV